MQNEIAMNWVSWAGQLFFCHYIFQIIPRSRLLELPNLLSFIPVWMNAPPKIFQTQNGGNKHLIAIAMGTYTI